MIVNIEHSEFEDVLSYVTSLRILRHLDMDRTIMRRVFTSCINHGFAVKVLNKDKEIVGCMFAQLGQNQWGATVTKELLSYATEQTPQLLRAYSKWGEKNKVSLLSVSNSLGGERYEKLIQALGFTTKTTTFVKEINHG